MKAIESKRNLKQNEHKAIANTRCLFRGSSHRSTPRPHLREGFPLSTEDFIRSTEDRSTELHHLQTSTEEVSQQEQEEGTSSQVITKRITNFLQTFSLQLPYRMRMGFLALEV